MSPCLSLRRRLPGQASAHVGWLGALDSPSVAPGTPWSRTPGILRPITSAHMCALLTGWWRSVPGPPERQGGCPSQDTQVGGRQAVSSWAAVTRGGCRGASAREARPPAHLPLPPLQALAAVPAALWTLLRVTELRWGWGEDLLSSRTGPQGPCRAFPVGTPLSSASLPGSGPQGGPGAQILSQAGLRGPATVTRSVRIFL